MDDNQNLYTYVFDLDYGDRVKEKDFILKVLQKFDNDSLVGANIYVNNNSYHFEFYFYLKFEHRQEDFERWIKENYPEKYRRFNIFAEELIFNNAIGLLNGCELEYLLTPDSNKIFIFPERKIMDAQIPPRKGFYLSCI